MSTGHEVSNTSQSNPTCGDFHLRAYYSSHKGQPGLLGRPTVQSITGSFGEGLGTVLTIHVFVRHCLR